MSEAQPQVPTESILIADCGSTVTKIVLLDVVEGQYRFVAHADAPSTVNDTWDDVSIGMVHAIRSMESTTGKTLLDGEGQLIRPESLDGQGVDRFVAVSSAARPVRAVLAGVTRGISLASARRAALTTYCQIVDEISLDQDPAVKSPQTDDDKINAIWHAAPEIICIVGGTDGGATEGVLDIVRNIVRVALYLMGESVPTVIYAGNAQLREAVTQLIGELAPLHIVDNVRPRSGVEDLGPLAEEIELCFYEQQLKFLPGGDVLTKWGAPAILPAARTADYTIRYCDRAWNQDKPALGVDLGSASLTLNICQDGYSMTAVRDDLGLGYGLDSLLERIDVDELYDYLPFELDESEIRTRLMNSALKPTSIPQTREDLLLELAVARVALRIAARDLWVGWDVQTEVDGDELMIPPCDPLIASGGILARVPYYGYAALVLLDALQPVGISGLFLDEHNLVASLGAVANTHPLAMVQTLRSGGLTFLGTAIVPVGRAQLGARALTVRTVDSAANIAAQVAYGGLEAIPFQGLAPGTMLELLPARGFDIGSGPGRSARMRYRGGSIGLIIDARGRPIELVDDPEVQRSRIEDWLSGMMSA